MYCRAHQEDGPGRFPFVDSVWPKPGGEVIPYFDKREVEQRRAAVG